MKTILSARYGLALVVLCLSLIGCATSAPPEGGTVQIEFIGKEIRDLGKKGSSGFSLKKLSPESREYKAGHIKLESKRIGVVISFVAPGEYCMAAIEVENNGSSMVRILWDQSSLNFDLGNGERPIPLIQVKAAGSVAPTSASPTVIAPGGKFSDVILSLDRTSTANSYSSLYQGSRRVGTFADGTYVKHKAMIPCRYEDYSPRAEVDKVIAVESSDPMTRPGQKTRTIKTLETQESWESRVKTLAEQRFLKRPVSALMTFEVDGVAYPLQFLFEAQGVTIRSESSDKKAQPVVPAKTQ